MKLLFKYMGKYKGLILLSFVLIGFAVASQLIQPDLLKSIIEGIVTNDTSKLYNQGLILVIFAVLGLAAGIANTVIAAKISQNVGAQMREDIFAKVQSFSFTTIEKFTPSNLVVRLTNDTQQAQNLVMIILQSLTRIPLLFIGSFILAMTVLPELWWIVILVLVVVIVVVMIAFGMMGPKFGKIQQLIERINTIAKENFTGIRVVKSFVQEDDEIKKFSDISKDLTKETIAVGMIFSIMIPMFNIIAEGFTVFIVYLIGGMVDTDPSVISASVAFVNYLMMIMMSIIIGGMMMSFASRAIVSMNRIQEVLNATSEIDFPEVSAEITSGTLAFEDVSFTYEGDEDHSIYNVSFDIQNGQTLGIIGATGSGKTTLTQLMARIYDADGGRVLIDGKDIKTYSEDVLRENVSLVLQRPILFSGTIADNIRQGDKHATDEEMMDAAKIAQAYEFIENEKGQFDAEVYQRGANFSGGQKQRISIARGVVGEPKILILDDSTSALDARSEKKVKEALMTKLPNTTKIIVSQKISSIVHADKILVLDEGKLVEQGTHKELIKSSPIYREIYEIQKGKEVAVHE